ncbi:MAG: hypothetical protein DHS20C14_00150 [Phycisphaeraceae bacterium]|nr:MAG: hypothetical protein DHS20C14_00150 [Phycisphaeraceae bacterium]
MPQTPAATEPTFSMGDRVLHPTKPEWGTGIVTSAAPARQDGRVCQRLQVRFDREGLKTISTAFVQLRPVSADASAIAEPAPATRDDAERSLGQLPDSATDPFATPAARLKGTLAQYRYGSSPADLFTWATDRTGTADPLSLFNRHELESAFDRWKNTLDAHLKKVVSECKTLAPAELAPIIADAPAAARDALKRVNRGR